MMATVVMCQVNKICFANLLKSNTKTFCNNSFYINNIKYKNKLYCNNKLKAIKSENELLSNSSITSISVNSTYYIQNRYYSSEKNTNLQHGPGKQKSLPTLMSFPEIVWPSVLKTIKNWILVTFIVKPYFDNDFSLQEFAQGSKQALQIVSDRISNNEFSNLDGLVAQNTVNEIQKSIAEMSISQRSEIKVNKNDIYFSFPYQVGIMFDETNENVQKRFVEITMVFHVLRGLKDMQERGHSPPINMGVLPEYRDKISICNYRFIKEFTKGSDSDWTINIVNHFKPSDFLNE